MPGSEALPGSARVAHGARALYEQFKGTTSVGGGWLGAPGHREDLRHLQEPDVTPEPERFLVGGKMRRTCPKDDKTPR